jgi:hypothetical protein
MRTLGVEIKGSDTLLVILDGAANDCKIELLSPSRLPLPKADPDLVNRLVSLQRQMRDIMKSERIDCVGVIRADDGCSPLRAKVECVIQLAARELSIPCTLVAAQTVAAAEKRKVSESAGTTLAETFQKVHPGYLRKAVHCAWSVMNAQ